MAEKKKPGRKPKAKIEEPVVGVAEVKTAKESKTEAESKVEPNGEIEA